MRRKDREVTDRQGMEEIIRMCKTCHVAMVDDGKPYMVPLSFGYRFTEEGLLELYFHSAKEGKKLDILRKNNQVCFEMANEGEPLTIDTPCNAGYYFASLIGFGEVFFLEDPAEKCEALSLMFAHQSGEKVVFNERQAAAVCVYKIVSEEFTGKRKQRPIKN